MMVLWLKEGILIQIEWHSEWCWSKHWRGTFPGVFVLIASVRSGVWIWAGYWACEQCWLWTSVSWVSTLWSPHIERRNGHKLISIRPQKSKDEKNIFDLYGVSIHQWCVCRMSICCWAFSHPSNELKLTTLVFSSLNDSQGGSEV